MRAPDGGAEDVAVVVLPSAPLPLRSGGTRRAYALIEAMECAGARPLLLAAADEGDADAVRARGWKIEVHAPPARRTITQRARQQVQRLPLAPVPSLERRVRELAHAGVAWVQLEEFRSLGYRTAARSGGTRVVVSLYNVDSRLLSGRAFARSGAAEALKSRWRVARIAHQERAAARTVDALLCVSAADERHFATAGGCVVVVPNGVGEGLFEVAALPEEGPEHVLFSAQYAYAPNREGILRFLREGWPRLSEARPAARLRLTGPDVPPELERLAAADERIDLLGFVPSIEAELELAGVVVVPLWEGGGTRLKVVEAMAAARPVVGTPLGVEELGFRDGEHGLVAGDPLGLADGCAALLSDRARARGLGLAGRAHADAVRWPRATAPARDLYAGWLAQDAQRSQPPSPAPALLP